MPRYRFSEFLLSPRRRALLRNGCEQPLIPRYFDLLLFLIERRGHAVHRRDIFDSVWSDVVVSDSALSQAIRTIRRVLDDDPREPRFVRTVSRHGYEFVFAEVVEEDEHEEAPVAAGFAARPWLAAATGGGVAGALGGAAGGVLLTLAPGSAAPLTIVPVLAVIGAVCGALGAAGVGAGLSIAESVIPSRPALAAIGGAAAGGGCIGLIVQLLGRWSLAVLVGIAPEVGGGLQGLVIGGAAGLGYLAATGHTIEGSAGSRGYGRLSAAGLTAGVCGLAGLGLALSGRPLVGGTIHAIAQAAVGGQAVLTPLGRLIGEPGFGPITAALISVGEGTTFGFGLALGLTGRRAPRTVRPISRTSHAALTHR